jgi:PKD repeat protein
MKKYILSLFLLVYLTNVFSQTGVMDNFDDNVLDPGWQFLLSCPAPASPCYTGTETNSELKVVTTAVGPAYENFEFDFPSIDLTTNPVVKINVKNAAAFNMRMDLTDINGNATNASPNVKAIPVSASYVQYTFDFTGKFSQTSPAAATVDQTKIVKVVIFVNPGGTAFSNTIFLNDLIVGNPPAPVPTFTQSATTICTNAPVTFTNTSSNGVTSYAWNFGTGASPATATTYGPQSVTWSTTGIKTLTLTVTGPGGTNTFTSSVTVTGVPTSTGTISGSAFQCSGSSATYSLAAVAGATSYTWSLPAGASISGSANTNNVTVIFGSSGGNISATPVNSCGNGTPSANFAVTVNPIVPASVTISASPSNSICIGTTVTFAATPANGGSAPAYQWKLNGTNVGTNSSTYTNSALANNDKITVVMTSNASCVTGSPAASNQITMTVSSGGTPSITITTANQTVCSGDDIIFTTAVTNGGPNPVFSWKQNGITLAGEDNDSLIADLFSDKDVFSAIVTGSGCSSGSATSNLYTINVIPSNMANVFAATPSDTVCLNVPTTFTATSVNGGTSPSYQWQVNGNSIAGANGTTFIYTLNNNDIVTVVMNSNSTISCLRDNPATSTPLTMKVVSSMTSAVKISSSATTICSGLPVTFTATPLRNGGTSPSFQWKINGINQPGQTASTFNTSALANNDQVTCVMTSSISCAQPSTSNSITITVTTTVAPSVSISTPSTSVCTGSSATFTANPTNGGSAPAYQWYKNSINQGAVLSTFTPGSLSNNDIITVVMTSNLSCASTPTATSPGITMTVNPLVTPSLTISSTTTTICPGSSVTFTALQVNGGPSPTYVWKTNGIPTGATGVTYTVSNLVNGDAVSCEMTPDHPCGSTAKVVSSAIAITVTPTVAASVNITSSPATLCPSTAVTFAAFQANGGSSPVYQWKLNGANAGTNSATYNNAGLAAGDVVTCQLTSNAACVIGSPANSNSLTVNTSSNAAITISESANPICNGTNVTFTSVITGGGNTPAYVWKNKGAVISGATGPTYSSSALVNGDIITCVMTSSAVCAIGSPALSNSITMSVTATPTVTVGISTTTPSICGGSSATITATQTNAGSSPVYQWQVNGQNVGNNSAVFTSSTFANNDTIRVIMTSSAACAGSIATSNNITMTVSNPPSAPNAGFDQFITSPTGTLSATPPASGTGTWSTTGSASITNTSNPNSNVSNLSTGTNTFTWTVTSGVCPSSSDDVVINVGSKPVPKNISGLIDVVAGATGVTYSISPVEAGSSYTWTVAGASLASGQGTNSIAVDFGNTEGTADIFVTEFNNYGDYTATLHVNIGLAPTQKVITGPDYAVVNSSGIAYSIPASSGSTYSWTITGATPATGASDIINIDFGSTTGTVTLSVTETNNFGTMTATKTVDVGMYPATPIIIGPDSVVTGSTISYMIDTHSGSSYLWSNVPNVTIASPASNITDITFTASGSVTLVVTESNASGPATATKPIVVGAVATVSSISGSTSVQPGVQYTFTAQTSSSTHSNFYWTFSPDQPTIVSKTGNTITIIFPAGIPNETITVTQDNGFGTSTSTLSITATPTGLGHSSGNSLAYTMFPNPFTEGVNFTFNTSLKSNLNLTVFNMNGEIVFTSNEYSTNETIVLGKEFPAGLYIVKAITDEKAQMIKINKE